MVFNYDSLIRACPPTPSTWVKINYFSNPKNIIQNFLPIPSHKQEKLDNLR